LCLNRIQGEQCVAVWVTKCSACFCTSCGSHIQQAVFSLSLSVMRFPCVLERQTQLHFNDTQMLLGFRMHVYVCVCVCVCVSSFWPLQWKACCCYSCSVYLPLTLPPQISPLQLIASPWMCVFVCVCVCVCVCEHAWVPSSESHEGLSGSEQLCLPWNSLSASSTLTGDLFTPLPFFFCFFFTVCPLFTNTYTHADYRESPDEMRQAVSFKWPRKQNCCWVINETNTRWHSLPLTFFLSCSPSLTQHKWSHLLSLLSSHPHT